MWAGRAAAGIDLGPFPVAARQRRTTNYLLKCRAWFTWKAEVTRVSTVGEAGECHETTVSPYYGPSRSLEVPMIRRLIVVAVTATLVGCATGLTPAGSLVRDLSNEPVFVRTNCEFIASLDASENMGGGLSENLRSVRNKIMNRVAELGGDTFLVVDNNADGASAFMTAEAYRCGELTQSSSWRLDDTYEVLAQLPAQPLVSRVLTPL